MAGFASNAAASLISSLASDHHLPSTTQPTPIPCPTHSDFYRNYISKSLPCLMLNPHPAFDPQTSPLATLPSLSTLIGPTLVTVNVTPSHGLGDALFPSPSATPEKIFVLPEEKEMTFEEFVGHLDPESETKRVYYYSSQNSNIHTECSPLLSLNLIPPTLPFAESAFLTGPPQAINLWVGDGRAITTMHRDPYENVYVVLKGVKVFTLVPPYMGGCLKQGFFRKGRWGVEAGEDVIVEDEDRRKDVKWIEDDPHDDAGLLEHVKPITIRVQAGECLYLPAMWFHEVRSEGISVAVNYWYDMEFNTPVYAMSEALNGIIGRENDPNPERA